MGEQGRTTKSVCVDHAGPTVGPNGEGFWL